MKPALQRRLLVIAASCGLLALALMMWTLFTASPLVLVGSMMIGQGLGSLAFLLYLSVVATELWTAARNAPPSAEAETPSSSDAAETPSASDEAPSLT